MVHPGKNDAPLSWRVLGVAAAKIGVLLYVRYDLVDRLFVGSHSDATSFHGTALYLTPLHRTADRLFVGAHSDTTSLHGTAPCLTSLHRTAPRRTLLVLLGDSSDRYGAQALAGERF